MNDKPERKCKFVILLGDPVEGFVVAGPLAENDDGAAGEWARVEYGGADWFYLPLYGPRDYPDGTVVVFCGGICSQFHFYGPFPDAPTAEEWAKKTWPARRYRCRGQVIALKPIDLEEIEAA
jgi:hypothetical protein